MSAAWTPPRPRVVPGLFALAVAASITGAIVAPAARTPVLLSYGLIGLVVAHEAGHFWAARRAGVVVHEFFVGFGPRIWSVTRGDTTYGIKAIPAGGYVKIAGFGADIDGPAAPGTYRAVSAPRRLLIVSAGVLVNLVLALGCYTVAIWGHGTETPTTTIAAVTPTSPAARADIRVGDEVVAIDKVILENWESVYATVRLNPNTPLTVTLRRDGMLLDTTVVPEDIAGQGRIGVSPHYREGTLAPWHAFGRATTALWHTTKDTATGLVSVFSPSRIASFTRSFTTPPPPTDTAVRPHSVIGIIDVGSQASRTSPWMMLSVLGLISLALAVFNAIPLLPLDGGHAAVVAYEAMASRIQGRPVRASYQALAPLGMMVLSVLLMMGVSAAYLDLRDIFTR